MRTTFLTMMTAAMMLPLTLGACDRKVAETTRTTQDPNGNVSRETKTVTQDPAGNTNVTREKETVTNKP